MEHPNDVKALVMVRQPKWFNQLNMIICEHCVNDGFLVPILLHDPTGRIIQRWMLNELLLQCPRCENKEPRVYTVLGNREGDCWLHAARPSFFDKFMQCKLWRSPTKKDVRLFGSMNRWPTTGEL